MTAMTTTDLKYWYKYFNKRFFRNSLPDVWVTFGRLPIGTQVMGRSHFAGPNYEPYKITVSSRLKHWDSVCIIILLHEMAHVSIGGKYAHGKRFFQELDRLYKAGVYTKVRGGLL